MCSFPVFNQCEACWAAAPWRWCCFLIHNSCSAPRAGLMQMPFVQQLKWSSFLYCFLSLSLAGFYFMLVLCPLLLLLSSPSLSNRNENTARTMVKAALAASASCVSTKRPCPPLLACNPDCSEARGNKQGLRCGNGGLTCSLWCRRSRFGWRLCADVVVVLGIQKYNETENLLFAALLSYIAVKNPNALIKMRQSKRVNLYLDWEFYKCWFKASFVDYECKMWKKKKKGFVFVVDLNSD